MWTDRTAKVIRQGRAWSAKHWIQRDRNNHAGYCRCDSDFITVFPPESSGDVAPARRSHSSSGPWESLPGRVRGGPSLCAAAWGQTGYHLGLLPRALRPIDQLPGWPRPARYQRGGIDPAGITGTRRAADLARRCTYRPSQLNDAVSRTAIEEGRHASPHLASSPRSSGNRKSW